MILPDRFQPDAPRPVNSWAPAAQLERGQDFADVPTSSIQGGCVSDPFGGPAQLRIARIDESVRWLITNLLQTHSDPAHALWEAGLQAVRPYVPDITEAEWTAACNRNFWPAYQAKMEMEEADPGSRNTYCPNSRNAEG
ncbi:MAG TPA: hypothetical protein VGN83_16220 [Falsiroseomonas sp.]|nr:hypothetical protein [Falsiroseomonas sp.]